MKINEIKTHELEKCYSICPLTYNGKEHILVAASDMTFADFDGDGQAEMLVMTPFHGDTIQIYKKIDGVYTCVKTFEEKYEFAYGIWGLRLMKSHSMRLRACKEWKKHESLYHWIV